MLLGCSNSVPLAMAVWEEDKTCERGGILGPLTSVEKELKFQAHRNMV